MKILTFALLIGLLSLTLRAAAEPWMANRFAQNCAACHSPGRVNLPEPDRRCTFSCKACHVSPNGGGIRNQYGKWNESRWLKSFSPSSWRLNSPPPAPLGEQKFNDEGVKRFMANLSKDASSEKTIYESGVAMKTSESLPDETNFQRRNAAYEDQIETDPRRFMYRVPSEDPLRQKNQQWFQAGLDMRYFFLNTGGSTDVNGANTAAESKSYSAFMGLDIGVEVEPVHSLHLVFEHRYGNPPDQDHWDEMYNGQNKVKSAYLLVDDLPYNGWVQSGLYRPLFGHVSANHTSLINEITGLSQFVTYNTTSIGAAPGAPFLNVHMINKKTGINDEQGMAEGTVVNLGGRFVASGLSLMLSYWNTLADISGQTTTRKMMAYDVGATLGKYVGNVNVTRVEVAVEDQSMDKGTIVTLENKYRFWRENYAVVNYSVAGTNRALREGNTTQLEFGVKTFWVSGFETELLMTATKERSETTQTLVDENNSQLQAHFFF